MTINDPKSPSEFSPVSADQTLEPATQALIIDAGKAGNKKGNPILQGGLLGCGTSLVLTILGLIGMGILRPRLNIEDGSQLSLGLGMLPVTIPVMIGALIFLLIIFRAAGYSVLGRGSNIGADGTTISIKT